ncbi:aldo/keto reductase [Martelella radicis]|uniref:Aryl-alcohol dehydrogenase-like predicted oxidoreductase n=1 Tax=Martelella radicis TaxID=1397476 RepID=A0A7W6KJM2_9HYPH|nr:aldo/keto reductase [Martelella radicis]MBB4122398.1 aryl-alcohol dehydrogenase-like predicted oxidoreductase [Martelella radicis]
MTTEKSGTFGIGGDLPVTRMGFGAMRLTGELVWGPPEDEAEARRILRRAVELGVNLIDTADVYGPEHNERIIREALHPYPEDLVIATKGGLLRAGRGTRENLMISHDAGEAHIREAVEGSLHRLGIERIDLYQLHRIDPEVPVEDTMGVFRALREEGKIRHVGLSEVSVAEIERARSVVEIATVQNHYNLADRSYEDVLAYCEEHGIGFMPFYPLNAGALAVDATATAIAERLGATKAQVALAWLLARSANMLLIPGTGSIDHLEENIGASALALSSEDFAALDAAGQKPG